MKKIILIFAVSLLLITYAEDCTEDDNTLANIRNLMKSEELLRTQPIQAYFQISYDEHQNFETDAYDKSVRFLSGFQGDYARLLITLEKAVLWTDPSSYNTFGDQLNCNWSIFNENHIESPHFAEWLVKELEPHSRIGFDSNIVSHYAWNELKSALGQYPIELVALNVSIIDAIWPNSLRGLPRSPDAFILETKYTGQNYTDKVDDVRKRVQNVGATALIVTALDEIAWLLNIRVVMNDRSDTTLPFLRCYVILDMETVTLYVNKSQLLRNDVIKKWQIQQTTINDKYTIQIRDYDDVWNDLRTISLSTLVPTRCSYAEGVSYAVFMHISARHRLSHPSPIIYLKAVKNDVEIVRIRQTNVRDAAAICDRLAFVEHQVTSNNNLTATDVARLIDNYRYSTLHEFATKFETQAYFHHNLLTINAKGQYFESYTKVTRSIFYGTNASETLKEAYTRVLLGHIQFANLTFPANMKVADSDVMARSPIWEIGQDYAHATGHGIGTSFREDPITVQYNVETSARESFQPGYFLTNEPAFHNPNNSINIRLTNVLAVIEKPWLRHTSGRNFLGFEVVTLVPYEIKLIKLSLLSTQQRMWLNDYNKQIRILVGAELKRRNRTAAFYWMMDKTRHIPEYGRANIVTLPTYFILVLISIISCSLN